MSTPRPNDPCPCGSGRKYKRCHEPRDRLARLQGKPLESALATIDRVMPGTVSPQKRMPAEILAPEYALNGKPGKARGGEPIKSEDQLARMRTACRTARTVLERVSDAVKPGVTTGELDELAMEICTELGCYPSPLNYLGFPKAICISVNEVICHGIPDDRPLQDGDIVNVDVTTYIDGMHGDNSQTLLVGNVDADKRRLVEITHQSMMAGIEVVGPGVKVREIGRAIQRVAEGAGYGVVQAFVGHGIGEFFHMDPQVPHYYDRAATYELKPGMTFTIEPMINIGTWRHVSWDDGWTAVTADYQPSAQFEHTVLVTDAGVEILTLPEGEAQPFAH